MAYPTDPIYKLCKHPTLDSKPTSVWKSNSDGSTLSIPLVGADDNTDYQEYLEWVAEGNTADPAD